MYDTVVIGNDLSSLIAAVGSARRGMKTLLLREGDLPDCYAASGYTFDVDPFPWFGLDQTLYLRRFPELSLFQSSELIPLDPGLQVILPDHRLDIFNDEERLVQEFEREFEGSARILKDIFAAVLSSNRTFFRMLAETESLVPQTLYQTARSLRFLPSLLRHRSMLLKKMREMDDPSILSVFKAEMLLFSNRYADRTYCLLAPYTLSRPFDCVLYPKGGKNRLISNLKDQFLSEGGEISEGCVINAIALSPGKCEIDLDAGGAPVKKNSKYLIASTKWENLQTRLLTHRRLNRLSRRLTNSQRILHPFTLHLGVLDKGIPEKMAGYVIIVLDETKPLTDQNLIFLEVSLPDDTGRAPDGKRALSATTFLKKPPAAMPDSALNETAAGLLQNLEGFLPFLRENLEWYDQDYCIGLSRKYQEVVNAKYRIKRRPFSLLSSLSNRTPLKNIFLTGGELYAPLGFEGEIVSGIIAANLVSGSHGR